MRNKQQIEREARSILAEFTDAFPVLAGLPLIVSTRVTRHAGKASWRKGVPAKITVYLPFFADESNDLRRTVTHEAAHIVAGFRAAHGPEWKRIHRLMGGKGDRCHTMSLAEGYAHKPRRRAPRVQVICPKCSKPMSLGPTQGRKHLLGIAKYTHARCPR